MNNVPADLIERVDVVTGGNSAIYGSDAIAGVVNFILKRDYDGIQLRGQAGVSDKGDSGSQFVSGIFGKNFGDGRGNVAVAGEYAKQAVLYVLDREQGRNRQQFQLVQNQGANLNPFAGALRSGGEPAAGDGIPDTAFIGNLRRITTSVGGTFSATCPTAAATGESAIAFSARRAIACSGVANPGSSNTLSQFGSAFAFQPDGTLLPNGCITDFRGFGSGNCIGGFGSTLREAGQFQPSLERIGGTILAHYEISPALIPFVEAQYTHINAVQESSPTFGLQSTIAQQNILFSTTNPFLTPQARATLASALAPGATTFSLDRQNLDFGARGEDHERETYRIVGGLRGDISESLNYELSANYGKFKSFYETQGNIVRSRYANAIQAVLAPATFTGSNFALNQSGQRVVCSINADVSTTNDDAACIPVNLFGAGNVTPEALKYFSVTSSRRQKNEQFVLSGFVSGDTSGFLTLQGGPIGFAVGGEYRTEKQFSAFDEFTSQAPARTFLNAIGALTPPTYKIKEAYAEVRVPLLSGLPFAEELTIEGAGRVSDYNLGNTGTVYAYNAGLIYVPVPDLKFRGSYQRSVRAPNLGDLFSAPSQTFLNNFNDPCAIQNINNNPNRVKNCKDAGVPTTQTFIVNGVSTTEPFSNRSGGGISAANRGNPELQEETADSWTFGFVATPRILPGFSLSVDYYKIKIQDVLFTLGGATVIDLCYDSTTGIDNVFCNVVTRAPDGTFAGQTSVQQGGSIVTLTNPININNFAVFGQPFNYAKLETSGVDVDLNYERQIGSDAKLSFRGLFSYLIKRDSFNNVTDPTFRDRIKSELGDPEWRFQISTALEFGAFRLSHRLQYVGKQILNLNEYETFFGIDGRPALNPDTAPFAYYPEKFYNDFRLEIDATERFKFYVGVDNAFDTCPPFDLIGTEGGSLYDPTGRFFYSGFRATF